MLQMPCGLQVIKSYSILQAPCVVLSFAPVCCTYCASDGWFWFRHAASILQRAECLLPNAVKSPCSLQIWFQILQASWKYCAMAMSTQWTDVASYHAMRRRKLRNAASTEQSCANILRLRDQPVAHRCFSTEFAHTDAFTVRSFYTQISLHTGAFTQACFYTEELLHTDTRVLLHTDAFTQRCFYTGMLLHRSTFTQGFFWQSILYTEAFTHAHTRTLPQRVNFAQKYIYAEAFFSTQIARRYSTKRCFSTSTFNAEMSLHRGAFRLGRL